MEYSTGDIVEGSAFRWIRNGNKRCIVVFSSFALRDYGPEAFSFRSFFEIHKSIADFIFIKDVSNQWYNRRLDGLGDSVEKTASSLANLTGNYAHVSCFGSSMGAYASLLYGALLGADHVIAVSPQTFLGAPFPRHNCDRHKGSFVDLRVLPNHAHSVVDVVVGEDNIFDIYQAIPFLDRPKTRVSIVPGEYHVVVDYWNEISLLPSIAQSICDGSSTTALKELEKNYNQKSLVAAGLESMQFRANILTGVEAFYNGRYPETIDALEGAQTAEDWLGATVMLAESYLRVGDANRAISLFDLVSTKSSRIDDFYPVFAQALALADQPERAIDAASRGALLNRAMRRSFALIADVFETKGLRTQANECRTRAKI